jgi:hypothetical protein
VAYPEVFTVTSEAGSVHIKLDRSAQLDMLTLDLNEANALISQLIRAAREARTRPASNDR